MRSFAGRRLLLSRLAAAIWLLIGFGSSPLAGQPPGDTDEELSRQKQIVGISPRCRNFKSAAPDP